MCYITLAMLSDVYAKPKVSNFQHKISHIILPKKNLLLPKSPDIRTQSYSKHYDNTNPIFTIHIKGSVNHEAGKIRKTYFLNFNMAFV